MASIAVFASGNGSNAQEIIEYFKFNKDISVDLIISDNKNAFVLERAEDNKIDTIVLNKEQVSDAEYLIKILSNIDYVVLAGYLKKIPLQLINKFEKKIVNIHPALLPKFGGKGMYGEKVHQSVIHNNEKESGITIHYVNEHYDQGQIIFQAACAITKEDDAELLANKIHALEHKYYPEVINKLIKGQL